MSKVQGSAAPASSRGALPTAAQAAVRASAYDAVRVSTLESLEAELVEVRQRISSYSKRTTQLEIELEQIDKEQSRAFRRAHELAESITTEENRLAADDPAGVERKVREQQVVELLKRRGELSSAQVVAELQISPGYGYFLLKQLAGAGRVTRVARGLWRAGKR